MIVAYLTHPVSGGAVVATDDVTTVRAARAAVAANVQRARRWLKYLQEKYPDRAFVAPWILWIELGDDDTDPQQRERGLQRCEETARRADEIWVVGGRRSGGMKREIKQAEFTGAIVRTEFENLEEPPVGGGGSR